MEEEKKIKNQRMNEVMKPTDFWIILFYGVT